MVEQLAGYFVDFGETVVVGTSTATCIVDMPTVDMVDAIGRDLVLTVPEADVPGVAQGDSVTLRATAYTVRTVLSDGQGVASIVVTKP
jgi:predicted RecA/RadA family phage recombinase